MEGGVVILVLLIGIIINFIPTIIAINKDHHNKIGVFLVNFFFGWTLIGWVVALIWSLSKPPQVQVVHSEPTVNKSPNAANELARLADLRDKGVLTEEEFNQQKKKLLA